MLSIGALTWRVLADIKRARRERANDVGTSLAKSQDIRQNKPAADGETGIGIVPSGKDQGGALVIRRWPDWSDIEGKRTGGAMGMATARQGMPSINSLGGRSFDSPGEDSPDRLRRGDGE